MRFWWRSWRRDSTLDDFADAIRGELAEMRTPTADDRLLARIRASRRSGARVILPVSDPPRRRRPLFVASAVAAAAIVVLLVGHSMRNDAAPAVSSGDGWFASDLAFASAPQATRGAPLRITHAERLRPVTLRYSRSVRDPSGGVRFAESQVTLRRDTIDGVASWRLVVVRGGFDGGREIDSVWVSAGTLEPLRQIIVSMPYRSYERLTVWQRFRGFDVTGEMKAIRDGELSAHRRFERTLPADEGPYVPDALAPVYFAGVALDRDWSGHASLPGWLVRDDDIFTSVDIRVDGEETISVPAGSFPCWRLVIAYGGRTQSQWVRKSDGVAVRLVDASDPRGMREVVLRSE